MRKKIDLKKILAEHERQSRADEAFYRQVAKDLREGLAKLCVKYNLPFEPPFNDEAEIDEIIKLSREAETKEIEKVFPRYRLLPEAQQLNAKLICKYGLNPKLSLKNFHAIRDAISVKLKGRKVNSLPEIKPDKKRKFSLPQDEPNPSLFKTS